MLMKKIKTILLTDWHLMRVVRLVFGISFGMAAYVKSDTITALASAFFLYQAFMNISCGLGNTCNAKYKTPPDGHAQEITYEEIK
jgi:hypothetical protein